MTVLITGGSGYIGSCLYEGLKDYHDVTKISRNQVDLTHYVSLKRFLKEKYFDVVIHCAVKGGSRLRKDSWKDYDENLMMYYNLVQLEDHYGKMIHLGSGAELYAPHQSYGFSKLAISRSIVNKKNYYNLRIFGVFDARESDTRFIKANINRYIKSQSMVIHKNKAMDMLYMQDLIKMVNHYALNENLPKEIDCVYEKTQTLLDIAHVINSLGSKYVPINIESEELDADYIGKYTDLGLDFMGLERGVRDTYEKINIYYNSKYESAESIGNHVDLS